MGSFFSAFCFSKRACSFFQTQAHLILQYKGGFCIEVAPAVFIKKNHERIVEVNCVGLVKVNTVLSVFSPSEFWVTQRMFNEVNSGAFEGCCIELFHAVLVV